MTYDDQIVFLIVISQVFGIWHLAFGVQCFDVQKLPVLACEQGVLVAS